MDIREAILEEHSKMQSEIVTGYIGKDQRRFDDLMALVFSHEETVARRAAWVMGHCCKDHPDLIAPHLKQLVEFISRAETHAAITRNALLILQTVEIPGETRGRVFNLCFDKVDTPDEMAATRIYAMTILVRICHWEPALTDEVALLIKQHVRHSSNGFKGRARHHLKELQKLR